MRKRKLKISYSETRETLMEILPDDILNIESTEYSLMIPTQYEAGTYTYQFCSNNKKLNDVWNDYELIVTEYESITGYDPDYIDGFSESVADYADDWKVSRISYISKVELSKKVYLIQCKDLIYVLKNTVFNYSVITRHQLPLPGVIVDELPSNPQVNTMYYINNGNLYDGYTYVANNLNQGWHVKHNIKYSDIYYMFNDIFPDSMVSAINHLKENIEENTKLDCIINANYDNINYVKPSGVHITALRALQTFCTANASGLSIDYPAEFTVRFNQVKYNSFLTQETNIDNKCVLSQIISSDNPVDKIEITTATEVSIRDGGGYAWGYNDGGPSTYATVISQGDTEGFLYEYNLTLTELASRISERGGTRVVKISSSEDKITTGYYLHRLTWPFSSQDSSKPIIIKDMQTYNLYCDDDDEYISGVEYAHAGVMPVGSKFLLGLTYDTCEVDSTPRKTTLEKEYQRKYLTTDTLSIDLSGIVTDEENYSTVIDYLMNVKYLNLKIKHEKLNKDDVISVCIDDTRYYAAIEKLSESSNNQSFYDITARVFKEEPINAAVYGEDSIYNQVIYKGE